MNRVVVHEESKRGAARAGEKGSPPNKNAWQLRHAFNCQRVSYSDLLLLLLVILYLPLQVFSEFFG